jgi:hypothetical protein
MAMTGSNSIFHTRRRAPGGLLCVDRALSQTAKLNQPLPGVDLGGPKDQALAAVYVTFSVSPLST